MSGLGVRAGTAFKDGPGEQKKGVSGESFEKDPKGHALEAR